MQFWIERHPVSSYYVLAYACSWSVALPLALQAQAAFLLEGTDDACPRLVVRNWAGRGYRFHGLPMWLIKLGHVIMQRKQLVGIAERAEMAATAAA